MRNETKIIVEKKLSVMTKEEKKVGREKSRTGQAVNDLWIVIQNFICISRSYLKLRLCR